MESSGQPNQPYLDRREFGEFAFHLSTGELWSGSQRVKLQRQPAIVLGMLVSRPGEVISREQMRQALWGSDTHVDFEQGISWCIRQIRKVLEDDAAAPRFIETVAKQGYRFVAACKAPPPPTVTWAQRFGSVSLFWKAAITCAVALAIAASVYETTAIPRTILVLPLDNFTGDRRGDTLADARTEYLISALGANDPKRLRVIDRPTAAKFKRTGDCIVRIGREVGADYVFVGSISSSDLGWRLLGGVFRVTDNTQVWTTGDVGVSVVSDTALRELMKAVAASVSTAR